MSRVLLIVNLQKAHAQTLGEEIAACLTERGDDITVYSYDGEAGPMKQGPFNLAISLGGDGTVLFAARSMAPLGIPILPVNAGTLGFIAAVQGGEWLSVYERWEAGKAPLSGRAMLELKVERHGKTIINTVCLNDTVISASGIAKLIRLHVAGKTIRPGHYRSDGLIVATPTGSTAYAAAAGGPILDPEMEAVILNPICSFSLSARPMVVPMDETISVEIGKDQRSGVLLTVDGQIVEPLEPEDVVYLRKAPYKTCLVASDREVFYRVLRTKLNWSPGGDAHA
ncbi:MAG: NAD(+)/NADH kinase [Spirochaetaceae bacterium]|jgi:NAD+ kinase|nr:NAD(+)/NADH kinase [Spirochaetaceae bacterium]